MSSLRVHGGRAAASLVVASLALATGLFAGCAAPDAATPAPGAGAPVEASSAVAADPLPSWRAGAVKLSIVKFVADTTRPGSPSFVPPEERVATFDNDGTLWSEQPLYFQVMFLLDQVRAAAPNHPEWQNNPAFRALMANDMAGLAKTEKQLLPLIAVANSGMSVEEYDKTIRDWLASAHHPTLKRPYTELIYQPQRELLNYLRANGFKTYIVSGGTIEFMRPWVGAVYGIPPEQVIGSSQLIKYGYRDGKPVLMREPKLDFIDDGPGKPIGIYRHIGRRPILAVGNSDGDLQMLEYTADGDGKRLAIVVHHDDAEREFAYDRTSKMGRLDKALDMANAQGWVVVSMKQDWQQIYPAPGP